MTINPIDRCLLRSIGKRCESLGFEYSDLYRLAVKVKMPPETLSAVARLGSDIAAISNRVYALLYPTGD